MLTPENIRYIVKWADAGNRPRFALGEGAWLLTGGLLETTIAGMRLNSAGLTIAAQERLTRRLRAVLSQMTELARAGWEVGDGVPAYLVTLEKQAKELLG